MNVQVSARTMKRKQEPSKNRSELQPNAGVEISERFALANREWYPGLREAHANKLAGSLPRFVETSGVPDDGLKGVVAGKSTPSPASPSMTDRFASANREWYPGLCKTCVKSESCTFPKPEGGVFNCDEFE